MVKDSGLRGRGGAGFPTGMKWGFIPQNDGKPHYLVVNADESEPGTCKDIPLMMANPHSLVEGVIITAYAIRASHAFIYVRGEVLHVIRRLQAAVREAYEKGYLGADILGSGYNLELVVHTGAGAYICGEETALLDSLEATAASPAQAAVPGGRRPVRVPDRDQQRRVDRLDPEHRGQRRRLVREHGHREVQGLRDLLPVRHVTRPGQYEAPLGITLRELLDMAGGIRAGHELKFWTPGGSSTPIFTAEHLDVPLDFESVGAKGSMLGTRALQIFDETTCVVRAVLRWSEFYAHEPAGSARRAARAPTGSS